MIGGESCGAEAGDVVARMTGGCRGEGLQVIPQLPFGERLDQSSAAVAGGGAGFVERVVGGVARIADEALREAEGVLHAAEFVEVPHEPFLVVGVVVNLIRQDVAADHVGMIDAGAGLLLPYGVVEALQLREGVAGHVPHVGDAGRCLAALRGGADGADGFAVIPQMNAVVMRRVIRHSGKDLIEHGIDHLGAGDGHIAFAEPDAPDEEGLGLDVLWIILHERLEVADGIKLALLLVALVVLVEVLEHGDPLLLAGVGLVLELHGLVEEALGTFVIVHVRHRHAPVGHGAVWIERGGLAEAALGFVIPEAVELADALREKLLRVRVLGADGELHRIAAARDEHRGLTRAFVEGLAVGGVAGERIGGESG